MKERRKRKKQDISGRRTGDVGTVGGVADGVS